MAYEKSPAEIFSDASKEKVFAVKNNAKVSVSIELSNADKQYLNDNFENGMYVDGFVKLDGKVDLSVPFLAF